MSEVNKMLKKLIEFLLSFEDFVLVMAEYSIGAEHMYLGDMR